MFLALKEMKHEKLHYGLITAMIVLISYLMFFLMGMMLGLQNENDAAIKEWDTQTVLLNKNSNDNLSQSLITRDQLPAKEQKETALVGQAPVVLKAHGASKESVQFVGLDPDQFISREKLKIASGHKVEKSNEIVVDESLKNDGYHLGDKVTINSQQDKYKIVGFVKDAKLSVAPVIYGDLSAWRNIRGVNNQAVASGVFSDRQLSKESYPKLEHYSVKEFINKLPGYSAQNNTFTFMIGFLMVISLIVIAVFLYILTMQKISHYAVMRAQGIPARHLVLATITQSVILMVCGVLGGILLTFITKLVIPTSVPVIMNWPIIALMAVGLVALGMIGSLLPVRMIVKIDPVKALN
ncbi:ABC transporter permease [Limosilactobacillus sp. STM2_1]|uniref:Putative hemin transport system permease protein HrtB n=1 Tax=Limosilactobacillus rudii TaxID=2759755 RepID=A0A7W3ULC3_9LACO|nr:ABC transporter permease [Limosilactobacillus rudii]MBB1079624.1 ABC transporter permease [Limosilactobacillus rudii]MBB1097702.1 ABC transporter permease [Limosilactobacillus rudii]MCD7134386.1 ABC transporter permease [Limosilactobacillus rudii]